MPIWKPNETIKNGRFLIKKTLGAGGFGITYLAQETANGKHVVIKTLNANCQNAENFREVQEKFMNEALKLSQFRHHHIVRVHELIQEGDLWGMVMEYIEGMELSDYVLERGQLKEAEALGYIDQIAQALDYVHQQGVLHRDVKPNNIMLRTGNREAILIDFGLARDFIDGKSLSMTNSLTHGYAPPEQYERHGNFAADTDVYALAATLYHLLTGQPPIPANIRQQHSINLPEPKGYNSAISNEVNHAIMQGMAMDAKQRPQNMTEFRKLLGLIQQLVVAPIAPVLKQVKPPKPVVILSKPTDELIEQVKARLVFSRQKVLLALLPSIVITILAGILFQIIFIIQQETAKKYSDSCRQKWGGQSCEKLLADYDMAIKLEPNNADIHFNRGIIKSDLGQKQESIADYNYASQVYQKQGNTEYYRRVQEQLKK